MKTCKITGVKALQSGLDIACGFTNFKNLLTEFKRSECLGKGGQEGQSFAWNEFSAFNMPDLFHLILRH